MASEGWICRYEIRDDGVYLDGKKIAENDAVDMVERFNVEQELFIGSRTNPPFYERVRRLLGGGSGTSRD